MAAGFLRELAGGRVDVTWAGIAPADALDPEVEDAMAEVGVELPREHPAELLDDDVIGADVVVAIGVGDACPYYLGRRYEDWELDDPADRGPDVARQVRDEIRHRVADLVVSLDRP
jgi:arsenate reductase